MDKGPLVALGLYVLLLVIGTLRASIGFWLVRRDARQEYNNLRAANANNASANVPKVEAKFIQEYVHAHGPRGLAYSTFALALAGLVTPIALILLTFIYNTTIVTPESAEPVLSQSVAEEVRAQLRRDGPLVHAFFLFFGLIASWGAVAWLVAFAYHKQVAKELKTAPLSLLEAVNAGKKKPMRKRPKWSPLVRTDEGLSLPEGYHSAKPELKTSKTNRP